MKRTRLAINSVSTKDYSFEEIVPAYAAAGFRNVELMLGQVKTYLQAGHTVADARALLDAHKLTCIGGFEGAITCFGDAAARRKNRAEVKANCELLAALGANSGALVFGTDGPNGPHPDPVGAIADAVGAVAREVKGTGVDLCIEFNWSPVIKTLPAAAAVARATKQKNVRVLFDPAHYHCTPTKLEHLDEKNVPFIGHVHVDDMRDVPPEFSNCNSDRALPGKGILPLADIFRRLAKHGYDGYYSIEMFNDKLWAMKPRAAAKRMYESLLPFCR